MAGEFDLIARHFRPLDGRSHRDVRLGIGDDCAILAVPPGQELALTTDTLVAGVHFPPATAAADIGWKSLACSLSDLAAAGAQPVWAMLAITLPKVDESWLQAFCEGFAALAAAHGVDLIGGDTTRGPELVITVQAGGHVPAGQALLRSGARTGDRILVSGWPGEAAAGLARVQAGQGRDDDPLVRRLHRPEPRIDLGIALRDMASASIDVSDGLIADLGHILAASGVGATIDLDHLPVSPALAAAGETTEVRNWILTGGDDYELCFTTSKSIKNNRINGITEPLHDIGAIESEPGLRLRDANGALVECSVGGFEHFRDAAR